MNCPLPSWAIPIPSRLAIGPSRLVIHLDSCRAALPPELSAPRIAAMSASNSKDFCRPMQQSIRVIPIASTAVGGSIRVTYIREKKEHEASLTVADRTKIFPDRTANGGNNENGPTPVEFGLRVEDLGTDRARRAGFEDMKGVLVTEVDPASFAEDIGFVRGDGITEVNHSNVSSVADYRHTVSGMKPGENVLVKIRRRTGGSQVHTVYPAGAITG